MTTNKLIGFQSLPSIFESTEEVVDTSTLIEDNNIDTSEIDNLIETLEESLGQAQVGEEVSEEEVKEEATVAPTPKKSRTNPNSKRQRALKIFQDNFGKVAPKDIQQMFIDQLEMTSAGSKTYYYTFKSNLGL